MDRNTLIYIGVGVAIVAVIVAWLALGGSAPDAASKTPVITTVPPHKLGCG